MSRRVRVGGRTLVVPDDATTEEIDALSQEGMGPGNVRQQEQSAPEGPGLLMRLLGAVRNPEQARKDAMATIPQNQAKNVMRDLQYVGDKAGISPTTAVSLTAPGSGWGATALRSLLTGATRTGEAALHGESSPLARGAGAAALQFAPEAIVKGARPVASGVLDSLPFYGPGRVARRVGNQLSHTISRAASQRTPAEAPHEWLKFGPTGMPASKLLDSVGRPVRPAADPVMIPHKSLRGWTALDLVEPKATPTTTKPDLSQLFRLLYRAPIAAGQEYTSGE